MKIGAIFQYTNIKRYKNDSLSIGFSTHWETDKTQFPSTRRNNSNLFLKLCKLAAILVCYLLFYQSYNIILGFFYPTPVKYLVATQGSAKTFCYYDENSNGLAPEQLNATLCDHIIVAFADIENNEIVPRATDRDGMWLRVLKLKQSSSYLRVLLSVGATAQKFSDATSNDTSLQKLVQSAVSVIQKYKFDGLDLDWEFPSWNGMPGEDRHNFIRLLRELRLAFDDPDNVGDRRKTILTAAVAAPAVIVDISYRVSKMALYLDYCLLMAYDFNRYNKLWPVAEFNSPLYRHKGEIFFLSFLNIVYASEMWVQKGMPKEKLIVGVPFYGVTFKLASSSLNSVGSPVVGTGIFDGELTYPQMCNLLESNGWTGVFHNESRVPYGYREKDWITFENCQSIKEKSQWILDNNYAGIMTYSLNCDDFNQTCQSSKRAFPLQTIVYEATQERNAGGLY